MAVYTIIHRGNFRSIIGNKIGICLISLVHSNMNTINFRVKRIRKNIIKAYQSVARRPAVLSHSVFPWMGCCPVMCEYIRIYPACEEFNNWRASNVLIDVSLER